MQQPIDRKHQEKISYARLPLAVYREISAHLQQLPGVTTEIIPQQSQEFNYQQSQVDSLSIQYDRDLDPACQDRLKEILNYYAERYT